MHQYIIIRTDIPLGHQLNCCAHAAALGTVRFLRDGNMPAWLVKPYTVTVQVATEILLKHAYDLLGADNAYAFIEDDLDSTVCAVATRPRPKHEYPDWIRQLPLAHRGCVVTPISLEESA